MRALKKILTTGGALLLTLIVLQFLAVNQQRVHVVTLLGDLPELSVGQWVLGSWLLGMIMGLLAMWLLKRPVATASKNSALKNPVPQNSVPQKST